MKQIFAIYIFLLLAPLACTSTKGSGITINKRHAQFGIENMPSSWHKKSFRESDLFFEHESHQAQIFVNAQCEKVSDSPLEALLAQMLVEMGKYEITSSSRTMVNNREALVAEVDVNLDGVNRYLKLMIYRKDRCVFDAVFSAPQKTALTEDFDRLTQTFWAEASP